MEIQERQSSHQAMISSVTPSSSEDQFSMSSKHNASLVAGAAHGSLANGCESPLDTDKVLRSPSNQQQQQQYHDNSGATHKTSVLDEASSEGAAKMTQLSTSQPFSEASDASIRADKMTFDSLAPRSSASFKSVHSAGVNSTLPQGDDEISQLLQVRDALVREVPASLRSASGGPFSVLIDASDQGAFLATTKNLPIEFKNGALVQSVGTDWEQLALESTDAAHRATRVNGHNDVSLSPQSQLSPKDMHVFGLCPMAEQVSLKPCPSCGKNILLQRFSRHRRNCPPSPVGMTEYTSDGLTVQQNGTADHGVAQEAEVVVLLDTPSKATPAEQSKAETAASGAAASATSGDRPGLILRIKSPPLIAGRDSMSSSAKPSPTKSDKAGASPKKEPEEPVNELDVICGVVDPMTGKLCPKTISCKIHTTRMKRQVVGRSMSFDELYQRHLTKVRAAREAKLGVRSIAIPDSQLAEHFDPSSPALRFDDRAFTTPVQVHAKPLAFPSWGAFRLPGGYAPLWRRRGAGLRAAFAACLGLTAKPDPPESLVANSKDPAAALHITSASEPQLSGLLSSEPLPRLNIASHAVAPKKRPAKAAGHSAVSDDRPAKKAPKVATTTAAASSAANRPSVSSTGANKPKSVTGSSQTSNTTKASNSKSEPTGTQPNAKGPAVAATTGTSPSRTSSKASAKQPASGVPTFTIKAPDGSNIHTTGLLNLGSQNSKKRRRGSSAATPKSESAKSSKATSSSPATPPKTKKAPARKRSTSSSSTTARSRTKPKSSALTSAAKSQAPGLGTNATVDDLAASLLKDAGTTTVTASSGEDLLSLLADDVDQDLNMLDAGGDDDLLSFGLADGSDATMSAQASHETSQLLAQLLAESEDI